MIRFSPVITTRTLHGARKCTIQGDTYQLGQVTGNDYIMGEFRQEISTGRFRLKNPAFSFPLWGVYSGDAADPVNSIFKAAVEYNGAYVPLKFSGNETITGTAGDNVTADPLGFDIPPNTTFRTRVAKQVPDVDGWFYDGGHGGGRFYSGDIDTAQTYTVGAFTGGNGLLSYGYGSIAVVGDMDNGFSLGIYGDSITAGIDSYATRGIDASFGGNEIPWVNYARSFEYLQSFVNSDGAKRRALTGNHSHMLMMFGTNDLGGSFSFNTMRNWFLDAFTYLKAQGQYVAVCTILPRTDSNNVVVDSDYQQGGVRDQLNAWLLTQVGVTIDEVVDVAAAIEDPMDHSIWVSGTTNDGTHPNEAGKVLMAPVITAWAETLS